MAFKGCVKFLQFNPSKPNKFYIKLFMVSEHLSGYISGFSVYTGKTCNELVTENATLDLYCSVTTKTVMGLLQKQNYWIMTEQFLFDNYFNSCKLLEECCTGTHMAQVSSTNITPHPPTPFPH